MRDCADTKKSHFNRRRSGDVWHSTDRRLSASRRILRRRQMGFKWIRAGRIAAYTYIPKWALLDVLQDSVQLVDAVVGDDQFPLTLRAMLDADPGAEALGQVVL